MFDECSQKGMMPSINHPEPLGFNFQNEPENQEKGRSKPEHRMSSCPCPLDGGGTAPLTMRCDMSQRTQSACSILDCGGKSDAMPLFGRWDALATIGPRSSFKSAVVARRSVGAVHDGVSLAPHYFPNGCFVKQVAPVGWV